MLIFCRMRHYVFIIIIISICTLEKLQSFTLVVIDNLLGNLVKQNW